MFLGDSPFFCFELNYIWEIAFSPVGRPIISGCVRPTERISAFLDRLLQPIAQRQASYLKDSTDFINFTESTEVPKHAIIVSMDVTSLYTNIPQEEGIKTVCKAYVTHYKDKPPIPTPVSYTHLTLPTKRIV